MVNFVPLSEIIANIICLLWTPVYSAKCIPNKSDHIKTGHLYYPVPNIKLFIDNDCSMIFFTIMNKNNQLIFNRYIFFSFTMVTFKIIKINNIAFLKKEKKLNVCLFDNFSTVLSSCLYLI
jgi:hypothetical protein